MCDADVLILLCHKLDYCHFVNILLGSLVHSSLQKLSADLYQNMRLSFDSSLSLDGVRPSTEPLILFSFLPSVPKSGKRTSALSFRRADWSKDGRAEPDETESRKQL